MVGKKIGREWNRSFAVLDMRKTLIFCRSQYLTILYQTRRGVMKGSINTEGIHIFLLAFYRNRRPSHTSHIATILEPCREQWNTTLFNPFQALRMYTIKNNSYMGRFPTP